MSETINTRNTGRDFRRQLLATVSALALLAAVYGSSEAEAADQDGDRPAVWIELGGQFERMNDSQEAFSPPFMASITQANLLHALNVQQSPAYAIGTEGKISFQSDESNWVFSASVRYGRSDATRHRHQQTANKPIPVHFHTGSGAYINFGSYYPDLHLKFADGMVKKSESHAVLDFQVGKDVGLGMFGNHGSSVLNAGVRIAQFSSKSNVNMRAEPDVNYPTTPVTSIPGFVKFLYTPKRFHDYAALESDRRNFRGAGPSLAWNAAAPFAGDPQRGEVIFDWGANAAILFGRQKASGHHQTIVQSYYENFFRVKGLGFGPNESIHHGHFYNRFHPQPNYYTGGASAHRTNAPPGFNRARSVVVPNLGGFAGLSFRYTTAKISLGYRADLFFNAMDGGIDAARKENVGFYGPFASVSIGLGG
jgi:iron complex outermembrane receptor protein